jgi:Protein of unknown function (DUF3592)
MRGTAMSSWSATTAFLSLPAQGGSTECCHDAIGGAGVIVIGIVLLALLFTGVWQGRVSLKWPTVEGEIVESYVWEDDEASRPRVRYRYQVDDQEYTSDFITFKAYWLVRKTAETMVDRYPVGSRVQVHYNPRRPNRAVLEPGASLPPAVALIFVLAWLAFGIYVSLGML